MEPVVFAAERFGFHAPFFEVLTDGLIHKTFKVTGNNRSAILQQVNTHVFKDIDIITGNYQLIYEHLERGSKLRIPAMLKTVDGKLTWIDKENSYWRAFEFIPNTYTESLPASSDKIFSAAKCYGAFTAALDDLDVQHLKPTIPGFHDLANRYNQLEAAVSHASHERLIKSRALLEKIEARKHLVDFYIGLKDNHGFRQRAMHHDTKLSNILFDKTSGQAVCPIDLDTVMPGYFFSDVGDMIRSMVSSHDENALADSVSVNAETYRAIISGYEAGIGNTFTSTEQENIHRSGMMMLYMQGIRFLADYLSNDVYYKINYPEQNFDRALNQITLLEKLEGFVAALPKA
ncbi:MAG TPA: aminoglycoside phosphotransferase family protein [Cyclobacteriaceae bacterium]|nr:aminoglycoside phosphotransferase family protein [Cyclobacteriaceae bacterium]HMV08251.1 aminoglycoside phosphotransferase family protein [Cyclobacteriaceae bacterium]HMV91493.1 aminoglycoside phosphotransferase family protein [Cyclobacteriaceae bacterium]HMX02094.1 aminoglycoside phosphotransferase family protein [Cyclobacteriaceae bacterium]HMX49930.1 aminoglycoside phosphotransferase family protein [Cyclobacteriaceae bacterium]